MAATELEGKTRMVCSACRFVQYPDLIVAVSAIVFDADKGLVLVRRAIEPGFGQWVIPGGYAESGESMEEAVLRETREEIDIALGTPCLSGVYSSKGSHAVTVVYVIPGIYDHPRIGPE